MINSIEILIKTDKHFRRKILVLKTKLVFFKVGLFIPIIYIRLQDKT